MSILSLVLKSSKAFNSSLLPEVYIYSVKIFSERHAHRTLPKAYNSEQTCFGSQEWSKVLCQTIHQVISFWEIDASGYSLSTRGDKDSILRRS